MLLTIMYAVWTNIYIVMYVAVSHVRNNVKQNPIKSCPFCSFFTFFTFFQRREGPLQRSEYVKKQQSGPVWIWLSQTTTIIMYVSFYNHVRREDKHQCYHVCCWPSCTLLGQISVSSCTLLSVMYAAMSNKIPLKSAPLLLFFFTFFVFSQCSKGPLQCSENVKRTTRGSGLNKQLWLSCTFLFIIMYAERTTPMLSCTLLTNINIAWSNIFIIMYVFTNHVP